MNKKFAALWLAAIILIILVTHSYIRLFTPPATDERDVSIVIPKGASFSLIAINLQNAGVIRDARGFSFLASLKGAYRRVKAGEYIFNTSMRPLNVLNKLLNGETKRYKITIPEGRNIREIAALLDRAGFVEKGEFVSKALDKGLAASMGVDGDTFEGYLFPDTYYLAKWMSAEEVIGKMVGRFREVYTEDVAKKAAELGLSQREVVTLASIIEKETGDPKERRPISAVFHNRLKRGMPLQSDPTVIYGISDFDGNLTKRHLRTRTSYNTYLFYGLPPGPIANPGEASIEAAVNPAKGGYLYFVSKNNGTHYFSKNLKDHNRAVSVYQKKRGRLKKTPGS
jgi:UPF0755 protein